jgi:DNA-binding XRE family transcriptional regulator
MSEDWARLAEAIAKARKARRWTQEQLAAEAGIGYSTVQRLESGRPFSRRPSTLIPVAWALGWDDGSVTSILAGGDPTMRPDRVDADDRAGVQGPSAQLPARVTHALAEGEVLDTEVLELSHNGVTLVLVAKRDPNRDAEGNQRMAEDVEDWTRFMRKVRGILDEEA